MQKTKGWKPTGREHVSLFRERKPHTLPKDEHLEGGEDKGRVQKVLQVTRAELRVTAGVQQGTLCPSLNLG